jgi:hypothetical protein
MILNSFAITNSTEEAIDLVANDTETAEDEFSNETIQAENQSAEGIFEICNNMLDDDQNGEIDESKCIKPELE